MVHVFNIMLLFHNENDGIPQLLIRYSTILPITPSIISNCHLHPQTPSYPGLVDVVHRERGRPRVAPRKWMTAAGRWCADHAMCTGVHPGQTVMGSPGRRPFPPRSLSSLFPTSHRSAMARAYRKSFNPIKTKNLRSAHYQRQPSSQRLFDTGDNIFYAALTATKSKSSTIFFQPKAAC